MAQRGTCPSPRARRLHCKLLVPEAHHCRALNCTVATALLCLLSGGLLGEHHVHGVALAAHFGVTLAEPGVLLPDPMAVTGPSHPFPRPGPGTATFTNGLQLASTTLASIPAHSGWLGHPVWGLLVAGAGTRAAPGVGTRWLGTPWPQLRGSPGAKIHRLELVRRDHGHHTGMVGRSQVFLKIYASRKNGL